MSSGARNCPFLMLTTRPGRGGGDEQIRLTREERGDLKNVGHCCGRLSLRRFVDVGQDRNTGRFPGTAREHPQSLAEAGSAKRRARTCGSPCRTTP